MYPPSSASDPPIPVTERDDGSAPIAPFAREADEEDDDDDDDEVAVAVRMVAEEEGRLNGAWRELTVGVELRGGKTLPRRPSLEREAARAISELKVEKVEKDRDGR